MTPRIMSVVLACIMAAAPAVSAEAPAVESLPQLVATALADNPELKASAARWEMFRSRIAQARALEDPMLMLKVQNGMVTDPVNFRGDPMTQKVVGISQLLPFWGKRDLKGEVASREAESYRWQAEERRLELRRMVTETYYQLYAVDRNREVVARNLKLLDDIVTLAETRYAVGQGVQQDVFKAQVERSRMLDMQLTLGQQRASLQAALNALLSRPADTVVGPCPDVEVAPLHRTAAELREAAHSRRPLVKSLEARVARGRASTQLAQKEFYPDVTVGLEYMQRDRFDGSSGDDMYSLGVTFNLPVQRERRRAMTAEASSDTAMAAEELHGITNGIDAGITDLLAQMERRRQQVELYRTGIIPQAGQALESATIGYRVGKVDFLTLLESRMTLFTYERDLYEALADYQIRRAQLEALVGMELP